MSKTTITLTEQHALLAAKAALANCANGDVTPVITGARLRIVEHRLEVTATDRYTVSRHSLAAMKATKEGALAPTKLSGELEVIVPRAALVWLSRNAAAFKGGMFGGKVTLEIHTSDAPDGAGHVTITASPVVGEREALAATFPLVKGLFPRVERLFDEAKPADFGVLSLAPEQLAKLHKFVPRYVAVRFEFTASEKRPNTPGPIKWTVADLSLDGLLQPNLLIA